MSTHHTDFEQLVRPGTAASARATARGLAANDQDGPGGLRQQTGSDDDISPALLARSIDRLSAGSIACVRAVEPGVLGTWRTWRRITLADGGWIRVIPIDLLAGEYLLQVAGPWADAAGCAGLARLKAAEVAPAIETQALAIDAWRAACAIGDVEQVLAQLGLTAAHWARRLAIVDRQAATLSASIAQDLCAMVSPDSDAAGKLSLRLVAGPLAWVGGGFDPREIDHTLTALKTAVEIRAHVDQLIQSSPDRAHRLLHGVDAIGGAAAAYAPVLWVSQTSLDLVRPGEVGVCVSVPAIELPGVLRGRMTRVPLELSNLSIAFQGPAWAVASRGAAFYKVAVASIERPWVATVGMDALERALAGHD